VKKPQWITVALALLITFLLYRFGRNTPIPESGKSTALMPESQQGITIDTFLAVSRKTLGPAQLRELDSLEKDTLVGIRPGGKVGAFLELSKFWSGPGNAFEPYAYYQAQAARLENSEKNLTFAARLFLENLESDNIAERRKWKALEAKDLLERSLKINPDNDSAKVGWGACYLFGGISSSPMEGIARIREVLDKDSTNIYAQFTMAKASLFSGQYDKAISRLQTVTRLQPGNVEAILMLADTYDRTGDKVNAFTWYKKSLSYISDPEEIAAIKKRMNELTP
jgi:tetratricopeptide (TPR) repeat protein